MTSSQADLADDYPASASTTGAVAVGGTANGTLETATDQDWFRVDLLAGHTYRIDLRGAGTGDGTLQDPYLYLRDDTGRLIASNDDGGGWLNSRLTYAAPEDGTWYVDVGSYADFSAGTYEIELQDLTGLRLIGTSNADLLVGGARNDTLEGLGGTDTLRGGAGGDLLRGGADNDLLDGGSGSDVLEGGLGNDRYVLRGSIDRVVEIYGTGRDTVIVSGIGYTLPAQVERLEMRGTLDIAGYGNALANVLLGNDGANMLSGGSGNDLLDGRGGADVLVGGSGADTFRFSTAAAAGQADRLNDFDVAQDRIALDDAAFGAIGPVGALAADAFHAGTAAADAQDRVIYDSATGRLYYDADGNGNGAAVQFATVAVGTALTAADFWVV